MRAPFLLLIPFALAGCSQTESLRSPQPSSERSDQPLTEQVADMAPPAVSVSAAPGVAFAYRYSFTLPAPRIAAVQEEHAQACEKLGLGRCRITGMRYSLIDERRIEAMLSFKLDPAIARQFGKSGTEVVAREDGKLVDSEISGHDAGAAIRTASRNLAQLDEDLRRIEEQLGRKGLAAVERERLQSEAQRLRQAIRASRDERADQEDSLATTPMTFSYGTATSGPALGEAAKRAGLSFASSMTILAIALIWLLPWLAVAGLAWALFRTLRLRWPPRRQAVAPETVAP